MDKKIFITGGAGYIGARLVPFLLAKGYIIKVYDIMMYKHKFKYHKNLIVEKGDIRNIKKIKKSCNGYNIFIHLACISNDPSADLDLKLTKSINLDCFSKIVDIARFNKISKFIYASSSSVYGLSKSKNVNENHILKPLTLYSKYKVLCEKILLKKTNKNFCGVIFRPATVCGYSERLRLDLTVNILTNFAYNKKKINVFGGKQLRPNLHILDYCELVKILIQAPNDLISNQIFNVGYENMSVEKIAKLTKKTVEKYIKKNIKIPIIKTKTNDNRSYHINSDKVYKILKFKPKRKIQFGIEELVRKFKSGKIKNSFDDNNYFNVRRMKEMNFK